MNLYFLSLLSQDRIREKKIEVEYVVNNKTFYNKNGRIKKRVKIQMLNYLEMRFPFLDQGDKIKIQGYRLHWKEPENIPNGIFQSAMFCSRMRKGTCNDLGFYYIQRHRYGKKKYDLFFLLNNHQNKTYDTQFNLLKIKIESKPQYGYGYTDELYFSLDPKIWKRSNLVLTYFMY
jgi:hypothetical protein